MLGYGDEVNMAVGRNWRSRLTLHFRDGSVDDDTTTYTQGPTLHLLSDHHIQKGPSFPKPLDMTIDAAKAEVTYREKETGELKTEAMKLPDDLANGMLPMVLQNFPSGADETKVGYVVSTPKPRLVTVAIHRDGQQNFSVGGAALHAARYRLHIDIGGVEGLIAPLIGKEPPDLGAWISTGDAPTFLKLQGFLYLGGPTLRVELTGPTWTTVSAATAR